MLIINKMLINSLISRECKRYVAPFCATVTCNGNACHTTPHTTNINSNTKQTTNNDSITNNPYYYKYQKKIEKRKQNLTQNFKVIDKITSHNDNVCYNESSNEKMSANKNVNKMDSSCIDGNDGTINSSRKRVYSGLDDIIKVDLLKDKTREEIAHIWNCYHQSKDYCIYAVISDKNYDKIYERSRLYPTFVYPIPRVNASQNDGNAYEFILSQFSGHQCYFTPLIAYQTHGANAPQCLTISHYPELETDKAIVLMFGEYDSNILSAFEAQCLANQLQWYYGLDGTHTPQHALLHAFNKQPKHFQYMELIKELEERMIGFSLDNNKNNNL